MSREDAVFRRFCDGKASLYRREWVRTGDVSAETFQLSVQTPCALCALSEQAPQRGEMARLCYQAKLFLPAGTAVTAGMRVLVEQGGRSLSFVTTGEPVCYDSHLEVAVVRDQWA